MICFGLFANVNGDVFDGNTMGQHMSSPTLLVLPMLVGEDSAGAWITCLPEQKVVYAKLVWHDITMMTKDVSA